MYYICLFNFKFIYEISNYANTYRILLNRNKLIRLTYYTDTNIEISRNKKIYFIYIYYKQMAKVSKRRIRRISRRSYRNLRAKRLRKKKSKYSRKNKRNKLSRKYKKNMRGGQEERFDGFGHEEPYKTIDLYAPVYEDDEILNIGIKTLGGNKIIDGINTNIQVILNSDKTKADSIIKWLSGSDPSNTTFTDFSFIKIIETCVEEFIRKQGILLSVERNKDNVLKWLYKKNDDGTYVSLNGILKTGVLVTSIKKSTNLLVNDLIVGYNNNNFVSTELHILKDTDFKQALRTVYGSYGSDPKTIKLTVLRLTE